MITIDNFTTDSRQKQVIQLEDGSSVTLSIYYSRLQYGWFIDELTYGEFTVKGMRLCTSPNLLHQFKNQIPFGLAVFNSDNREPTELEDLASGNFEFFILDEDEIEEYSDLLSGA